MSEGHDLSLDKEHYTREEVAALIHGVRNGVTVETRAIHRSEMCKGDNLRRVACGELTVIND